MTMTLTQPEPKVITDEQSGNLLLSMKQKWQSFNGSDKQVLVLAVLAIVVACVIVLALWSASQGYRALYGKQEQVDTSKIIEVLESEGINYQLETNTGLILVPEEKLGAARMLLAARGVKAKVPSGMEALDKSGIGTSQFLEQARYRHSLEGELARTIMALKVVRNARVHLAIPKKSLFIREKPELASASVMLDLYADANLTPQQIESIVNLVSGSVMGMKPERVQVVDQEGNHLSSVINIGEDMTQSRDRQLKYTNELEQSLIERASNMLLPVLGQDNFKVQVSAKVNFNQIEETKESLDPSTVIRSEQLSRDESNSDLALGIPGALSNQPPSTDSESDKNQRRNLREQNNRQFDVGRSVKHIKYQQMQLESLSVSVLLNNAAAGEAGWTDAQQQQISQMVRNAIGYSAERGDQFSINSFSFAPTVAVQFEPMPWWQSETYQVYLRYLIGCLLGFGLIIFVLRPLVKHLTRTVENEFEDNTNHDAKPLLSPEEQQAESLGALPKSAQTPEQAELSEAEWMHLHGLPEPGSPLTVKLEHLGLLAEKEPARVAEVISHWIKDKEVEENKEQ
ncbi:flagellar M-ring protein FliF [Shewanella sp. 202IG2-18]|uniref:flagellar basal-body MS-ring/collar protein FliF n=1 Tax=Parashewanella hymeniacidonis TaxID=2807618 RepID=UPI00196061DD|nr:flagellar basal-body MS-ring/collar protein FliF [Parashewanella hymeniacidonis]MBM7071623.1 flagellar M-ring protein FliF [Parashewanella hymeniacidonis]